MQIWTAGIRIVTPWGAGICNNLTASGVYYGLMKRLALSLAVSVLIAGIASGADPQAKTKGPTRTKKAAKKAAPPPPEGWPTWGGPRRNFVSPATGLSSSWPAAGPRRLWSRPLGDGYSPIAEENGVLYTAYRRGSQDVVTALDANSGKTVWEFAYDAPFTNGYSEGVGPGPYAMPQIVGERVITASGTGKIHSLDKKTGRPAWSHDLYREFGGTRLPFGYACHALPYKDTLIYLAGGRGSAVVAFRQGDGAVAWKNQSFTNAHSSPVLIDVDGQAQVAALLAQEVIGFDPENGQRLWQHPHATQHGLAVSTVVWGEGNVLLVSSAYSGGARALHLSRQGGQTRVKQIWHNPRLQSHFGSLIRLGDYAYLSSAYTGPAFLTAIELRTGNAVWQARDFAKAQLLYADGKLIVLDEDGNLGLVAANPKQFQILSRVPLLTRIAWTPPTLVGTRLYVRDRRTLIALDLGPVAKGR